MSHILPGTAHGSLLIENCSERIDSIDHTEVSENKPRFAALAVFYGWLLAGDRQFVYSNGVPHLVHSVDHGHFFHGGPNWSEATLNQAPSAQIDQGLVAACNIAANDIAPALAALRGVVPQQIAHAIATPPEEWGVSMDNRIVFAEYLYRRRTELLASQV